MMSLDRFVVREKNKRAAIINKEPVASSSGEEQVEDVSAEPKLKRHKLDLNQDLPGSVTAGTARGLSSLSWRKIRAENLSLDYARLYNKKDADALLHELEQVIVYNTGQLAKVQLFGKWIDIPRKQTAYGEDGLTYSFSGNTVPARPWIPALTCIRDVLTQLTGYHFNFVLVNRYANGNDYMGEHKDDEKDLSPGHPIASLSLGQPRDFYFKHQDARGSRATRRIEPVKLVLEHGSLLLMNPPTNRHWYHALPKRTRLPNIRINLTFRKMNPAKCKPAKGNGSL